MAGALHSVLFKAPGAQFVTLAGSSQANILYEMHFSRCLSEDQSSSSLARFSLFSFPAPIPTDKMSQFKANGSPIKITRASGGDRQGERDSYRGWMRFGQVGSN